MEPSLVHPTTNPPHPSKSTINFSTKDKHRHRPPPAPSAPSPPPPPPPPPPSSSSDLKLKFSLSHDGACRPSVQNPDQRPWRNLVRDCMAANSCEKDKHSAMDEVSEGGCSRNSSSNSVKKACGSEKYMSMKALAQERGNFEGTERVDGSNRVRLFSSKRKSGDDGHGRRLVSEKERKRLITAPMEADKMAIRVVARKGCGSDRKEGTEDVKRSQEERTTTIKEDLYHRHSLSKDKVRSPSVSITRDHPGGKEGTRSTPSPKHRKAVPLGSLPFKKAVKTMTALAADENPGFKQSSSQTDRGSTRKRSLAEVPGSPEARGTHEECCIDEFPVKFSHIIKKARSHRRRRSHEMLTHQRNVKQQQESTRAEPGRREMGRLGVGEDMPVTNLNSGAGCDEEDDIALSPEGVSGKAQKVEGTDMICNEVDDTGEMGKAELKHEGKFVEDVEKHAITGSNLRSKKPRVLEEMGTPNIEADPIGLGDTAGGYPEKDGGSPVLSDGGGDGAKNNTFRDAHIMSMCVETHPADDMAPLPLAVEVCKHPKGGSVLDFVESVHAEKEVPAKHDRTSRELKPKNVVRLSLSTAPESGGEGKGEGMQCQRSHAAQASENQNGKECTSHGHDKTAANLGLFQLSLGLPGTSVAPEGGKILEPVASAVPQRNAPSSNQSEMNISSGLAVAERNVLSSTPPERSASSSKDMQLQRLMQMETQTQNQTWTQIFSQSPARTNNSDGFTTSVSLSQSVMHNPSCSLNCTSLDNQDLSCGGSRPQSEANGQQSLPQRSWQSVGANEQTSRSRQSVGANAQMLTGYGGIVGLPQERAKHQSGIPLYQLSIHNGNIEPFPSASASNRSCGGNYTSHRDPAGGPKALLGTDFGPAWPAVKRKGSSDRLSQQEEEGGLQFPSARETRSEPLTQKEREKEGGCLESPMRRHGSIKAEGHGSSHSDKIGLHEIAMEPVAMMAQKMQELPDGFLEGLKCLAKDFLGCFEKREEFLAIQSAIKKRTDLTEHTLLHAHRAQLEILVALKTGMQTFVEQCAKLLTYKVLIEIFLETRCRNVDCQHPLPVDDCDCKICCQKKGFCHQCMCVACLKFDSDNQTCRWVGCDFCMHWCHTDCALRMSFIAPAISDGGGGTSEMQFRCPVCGRHTELLGFVMGVFREFAGTWDVEALAKELDCVRRIFHGSKDMKGQQLRWKVEELLQKLEKKAEAVEVQRSILQFFDEGIMNPGGATSINKQLNPLKMSEPADMGTLKKALPEAVVKMSPPNWNSKSLGVGNTPPLLQQQNFNQVLPERTTETAYLDPARAHRRAEIEDMQSMVRMKESEANMLQLRANEARKEASGLQLIIAMKVDKVEGDFTSNYAKLRLNEVEEMRTKRMEEMQALEKAHLDYEKMKIRMEAQIKDLVMKVEMSKWQCA